MQVRGAPDFGARRGWPAERTRRGIPHVTFGIRLERRDICAGQAPEENGRQRLAQQRREFRGIAGIRHHRGDSSSGGQAQPALQSRRRFHGVTVRRGKRHAVAPPAVWNSRRQARDFAACRVMSPWTYVDASAVRVRHDFEGVEREKSKGSSPEAAQAQRGHVVFPVQREQRSPTGARGAQERQAGEDAGAPGGKGRGKVFLGAHQKQEQPEGKKRRAEKPAEALASTALA